MRLLVGISGFGGDEARQRARDAQFDHYLIKPIDHTQLLALLNREKSVLPNDAV
ncbi:MAG: hypothetical protein ACYDC8_02400 [Gammaproteobacteria bacterium]